MNKTKPSGNNGREWRESLYRGEIYKLPENVESIELVQEVNTLLHKTFGVEELTNIHNQLSESQFFSAMKIIRKELFEKEKYIDLLSSLLLDLGFKSGSVAFEPLRLRAIRHNGHLNQRARAVYYPHRDTWYGHGQSMIVGWLPLHNQADHQTFEIYPEWFQQVVPNNSEVFNYDHWRQDGSDKKIGWQKKDTGITAIYPEATENVVINDVIRFSAKKGENLFFSGSHFHKTLKQTRNLSRFSVDYRLVYLDDHNNKLGAPNVDNRSQGSAVQDYIRL